MTNITPEQRLALARAVYPEHEWFTSANLVWSDAEVCRPFIPESDRVQLLDVLCWLLKHDGVVGSAVWHIPKESGMEWEIEHNCTTASLSDAVVRAAVRVMEGE